MSLERELLEKRINALTALQDIAQDLMTELDLERLLQKILEAAVRVLNSTEGSLWFWVPSDELVVLVSKDPSFVGERIAADRGLAGWVFSNLKPLIVGDVSKDEMYRVFNMGLGMVLVCQPSNVEKLQSTISDAVFVGEVADSRKPDVKVIID